MAQVKAQLHDCQTFDLKPIEHLVNETDWAVNGGLQTYHVYICKICGNYWGIRHQYKRETGRDDRMMRFGPDISLVHRHY